MEFKVLENHKNKISAMRLHLLNPFMTKAGKIYLIGLSRAK